MKISRRDLGLGTTAALATACGGGDESDLATTPSSLHINYGQWRVLGSTDVLAIHAVLMPNGRVLFWGGSQHDPNYPFGRTAVRQFNPDTNTVSNAADVPSNFDLFCSGHILTPEGKVMVVGGNESYPSNVLHQGLAHFGGLRTTLYYNYTTNTWTRGPDMPRGRWYPAVSMTRNNEMITLSGHPDLADALHHNTDVYVRSNETSAWSNIGTITPSDFYPRTFHELRTYIATGEAGLNRYRGVTQLGTWGNANFSDPIYNGLGCTGAMLPIRYNPSTDSWNSTKAMLINGVQPIWKPLSTTATDWTATPARPQPWAGVNPQVRTHGYATLLPTGDVFVSGGIQNPSSDGSNGTVDTSVYYSEIFRDDLQVWHVGQLATVRRNYHSVAMLLPDGRVWTAGGNNNAGFAQTNQPNGNGRELRIEVFEPWYYSLPQFTRPAITGWPGAMNADGRFYISCTHSDTIQKVVLIQPGSVTHAFNFGQKYIDLKIESRVTGQLNLRAATDYNLLPRGWYMMFTLIPSGGNAAGPLIPSIGRWIRRT
jgi:hypothetical protein